MTKLYIGSDNSVILDELKDTSTDLFLNSATVTFTLYRLQARDAVSVAASTTLNVASGPFVAGDVARSIVLLGAGADGSDLRTTISSYSSSTAVVLSASPSKSVTNGELRISVTNATAVSMSYVTDSSGKYRGTIDDDVALKDGDTYWVEVSADAGSDRKSLWVLEILAGYRT